MKKVNDPRYDDTVWITQHLHCQESDPEWS